MVAKRWPSMSPGFQTDLSGDSASSCPGIHESSMNEIRYTYCDGLLGRMLLVADEHGLRSINFPEQQESGAAET